MLDQEPEQRLEARGVIDILSETFTIYARHFWKFVALVAVVQVPLTLLALIPLDYVALSIAVNSVNVIAMMVVYGATICAVGQHYVTNNVSVRGCYARVTWRMISMMFLAAIMAVLLVSALLLMEARMVALIPLALLSAVALCAYTIYLTTTAPAVIVEGYKSMTALRRGFLLARSSEMRILGHLLIYSLVTIGLLIVLLLPFLLFANPAPEGQSPASIASPSLLLGSIVVGTLVPPVAYIATTLLYYDLRVRKEGYDMARLSTEMGVSPVRT